MYNYDSNNNTIEYYFKSVSELLDYIETTEFNPIFFKKISNTADWEFSHTESFEEALSLCKNGGLLTDIQRTNELINDLVAQTKYVYEPPKRYSSFTGFAPNVPAYLQGNPLNMYNIRKEKRKKIDVYFQAESNARTNATDMYEKGTLTMAIIKLLERYGYNVNLIFFIAIKTDSQRLLIRILLKEEKQRLDIISSYFPMCHPAFSRRIIFRLIEKIPDVDITWQHSYGNVCSDDLARYMLGAAKEDIFVRTLEDAKNELDKLTNINSQQKLVKIDK